MISINQNPDTGEIRMKFSGRMDTLAAMAIAEQLENEPVLLDRKPDDAMVLDLEEVDYIASSFIRICVSQARQAGPGRFSIVNCQPMVRKTFKISGLDEVLNII